ncbi:MAG: hypothetical protein QG632_782 [Candidatus Dependentiae bacterium]|nr:hypothetical protein [Candidatus Dependentiae bacterium]
MSMESLKVMFTLSREDAYSLACIAEHEGMTMQTLVRKVVLDEIKRREDELHVAEHGADCTSCKPRRRYGE